MFTEIICRLRAALGRAAVLGVTACAFLVLLPSAPAAGEETLWDFNLPADTAENSLKRFSQQFAPGVIFPTDLIQGVRTNAVHGRLTGREALDRLLAGTSLRAVHDPQTGGFAITSAGEKPGDPPPPRERAGRADGAITGRIINVATQEYVRNAEVRVRGTRLLAISGDDGYYRLNNVPAGSAEVTVSYTGQPPVSGTVQVGAGRITVRDFELGGAAGGALADGTVELARFTVSSEREGNAKAIMDQRAAMNIKNVVASDVFGDVAEGNVGEFLKFIPGIDIEYSEADTRAVRIRGMNPKYSAVTLDGNRMANAASSSIDTGRTFEFEQVSINSVEAIEVNKTISADMDADATAGAINLKSKSAFSRKGRFIAWQLNAVANSYEFNLRRSPGPNDHRTRKIKPGGILEFSDTYLDGKLGVVATVSESNMYNEQYYINYTYNYAATEARPAPVVLTQISYKDGPKFTQRSSASLNLDYRLAPHLTLSLRNSWNHYDAEVGNRVLAFTTSRPNLTPESNETLMIAQATANNATRVRISGNTFAKYGDTVNVSPRLDYKRDRLELDLSLAYSRAKNFYGNGGYPGVANVNLDLYPISWRAERSDPGSTVWDIQQLSGRSLYAMESWQNPYANNWTASSSPSGQRSARSQQYSGQFNAKWTAPWSRPTFFRAGLKVREEIYNQATYSYGLTYVGPEGDQRTAPLPVSSFEFDPEMGGTLSGDRRVPFPDREALGRLYAEHPTHFLPNPANETNPANLYPNRYIKEQIDAAYLLGNTRIDRLTLQGGLRVESTSTGAKTYERGQARRRTGSYDDVFFSGAAKYRFTDDLMAIASFSQALLRPDFANLTGVATINDETMRGSIPNPELKPEYSNNYSARLEYYFEPVGFLAAGVFMNRIKDIQYRGRELTAESIGLGDEYPGYIFTTTLNADALTMRGLELEYNQQLTFLPGALGGLSVFANYTRTLFSDQVLAGTVAPITASAGLSFRHRGWSASLRSVWTDDTYWSSASTYVRYRQDRLLFDLNASYQFSRRLTVFLNGRNIFNEPIQWWENEPGRLQYLQRFGVTWTFGIKGTF